MSDEYDSQIPALADVLEFSDDQPDSQRRWIVLFDEDYDDFVVDVEDNVGVLVDIDQTGEILRLAAETLADLSHKDATDDDVIRDMIAALKEVADE